MIKIVTIEDDTQLLETLVEQISQYKDYNVCGAQNIKDAKELIAKIEPDMILLDVILPDGDGRDLCKWIREKGYAMPILMLTAQNSEADAISGLEAGANDYINKPIRIGELLARIKTHLRQYQQQYTAKINIGPFQFWQGRKTLAHIDSGKILNLTEKEAAIIKYLLSKNGQVATKVELLEKIWGYNPSVSTHTLETHVYRLRQKVGYVDKTPLLITKDSGYKLARKEN